MKTLITLFALTLSTSFMAVAQDKAPQDWANYERYAEDNRELKATGKRPDVVFIGNSITDGWARQHPDFFANNNFVGRGIGGQVTAQMLARFRADVIDLAPRTVVILAGTNDIARNQGYVALENIAGNIFSMAEIARAHKIKVVICSVLPAAEYPWRPEVTDVANKVKTLNTLLRQWAARNNCTWVDYHSAMTDEHGGLPQSLARDGIHPTNDGYNIMENIILPILTKQ
jgi:lysophospholipase L1-like esterase